MLNLSSNTKYVSNDTMKTAIESADIFTAAILLLVTMLASGIIPFLRDIILAVLFYLGFIVIML